MSGHISHSRFAVEGPIVDGPVFLSVCGCQNKEES